MLRKLRHFWNQKFPFLVLDSIPDFLSRKILTSQIKITTDITSYKDISFKVANTAQELEQAFELVQDTYLKMGLTSDSNNLKRILKYNLLPTTLVIVAKYKEKVIATVSIISDSSFGLPIDEVSDITKLRYSQKNIAEISALVIARGWRRNNKKIYMPLVMYGIKIAESTLNIDEFVLVTNLAGKVFYNNIYGSKNLIKKKARYGSLNNADAHPQRIIPVESVSTLKKIKITGWSNFYEVYDKFPWKYCSDFSYTDYNGVFTKKRLETYYYFYVENIHRFGKSLSNKEIIHLQNIYNLDQELCVLKIDDLEKSNERRKTRFMVNIKMKDKDSGTEYQLIDLSQTGLKVKCDSRNAFAKNLTVLLHIREGLVIEMTISKAWQDRTLAGFHISSVDQVLWNSFISELNAKTPQAKDYKIAS